MSERVQNKILCFLNKHKGKKFSVGQIWEELAGVEDISYGLIQVNVQWLQYQKDSQIKTEKVGIFKYVWIEKGGK